MTRWQPDGCSLERGENVPTPPALWVQGVPISSRLRRRRLSDFPAMSLAVMSKLPQSGRRTNDIVYVPNDALSTNVSFEPVARFFRKHLG